ncbi:sensor histidine kinase [Pyxidicoccus xibeiensis]|uniref:sensor histidine kinase n=1 Tax=Pyxidicoccus xibeiensis TaxID=2906759 RepID=UPI0020A7ACB4|nr:histidine kinase [Pyxidicoccus xibeiensis]MCP3136526.1 histidine kinase [Pyxidicoccus xibeiensis]
MKSSRAWVYAACQLGGWGLYAGLNTVLAWKAWSTPLGWVLVSLSALALTHVARAQLSLRDWARLPLPTLSVRVLATAVMLGVVQCVPAFLVGVYVARVYTLEQARVLGFVMSAFVWSLMMLLWLLIYFVVHAVEHARHAELERWKLEAAVQAAELRFLKAQLQPHFLFNCLNSVRALISEDPARAQEVVTRLSSLLRYALAAREPETVPLERELQVVRDYLGLEGVRLEERLRVREDVEPAALCVPVPAMLVQTLVENAIKHGVGLTPEGGEVAVSARVHGGTLLLEVANTAAPLPHATRPEGSGVGLHNASERLRLLCGAGASLQLDQTQAARTTARVRIPLPS